MSPAPGGAEQVTVQTSDAARVPRRLSEAGGMGSFAGCGLVPAGNVWAGGPGEAEKALLVLRQAEHCVSTESPAEGGKAATFTCGIGSFPPPKAWP